MCGHVGGGKYSGYSVRQNGQAFTPGMHPLGATEMLQDKRRTEGARTGKEVMQPAAAIMRVLDGAALGVANGSGYR